QGSGAYSQRIGGKISPTYSDSTSSGRGPSAVPVGLPATPRAMRHPKYSNGYSDLDVPALPEMPDNFAALSDQAYRGPGWNIARSMCAPPEDIAEVVGRHAPGPRLDGRPLRNIVHRRETSHEK